MIWGFIWLMFILKIPIFGLFYICWWAVKQHEEPEPDEKAKLTPPRPHPHVPPKPRRPRGPHGADPAVPPSPPRARPLRAKSKQRERLH